ILKVHTRRVPLNSDVDLPRIAELTEGYSGADIEALVREAALRALRENMDTEYVSMKHLLNALKVVAPSLTTEMIRFYEEWGRRARQKLPRSLLHPLTPI
ncbi:MAG: AAA family ATPase, partial [Thermoprotei archaeon]